MKHAYSPTDAITELADQHDSLRDMMERCEQLADALDAGTAEPGPLLREVARLRSAFDAHNQFEEQLLRPVLLRAHSAPAGIGLASVSRMAEQHVEEHRSMRRQLGSETTSELRAVIANLRAHL